jgi:hypothetical protein
MDLGPSDVENRTEKVKIYFPVLIFILLTFFLEAVQLKKATSLVLSVLASLFSFGLISAYSSQKSENAQMFKPLTLKFGLLSIIFLAILAVAVMHWYQLGHVNLRWFLFFLVTLIYFVVLFRSVHHLRDIRKELEIRTKKTRK